MAMSERQLAIIDKVLKLMELAKDDRGHEGERDSATKMAAKLMSENDLTFADLRDGKIKDGYFKQYDMVMDKDMVDWERSLSSAVSTAFDVKVINQTSPWVLMFCGGQSDIDMAVYFFKYLRRSIHMLSTRTFNKKADQKNYAFGMVEVIGQRMRDLYAAKEQFGTSDSRALVVVKQDGLKEFVKNQFPNLTSGKTVRLNGSHASFMAGKEAGAKVNISRPVGHSGVARGAIA